MTLTDALDLAARHYGTGLWLMLAVIGIELLNLVCFRKLNGLGIVPREAGGLPGILCAPFLHTGLAHFLANLVPLLILCFLLGKLQPARFWEITSALVLGTGALVWLLARRVNHIGASGLIYALLGYLTLHGFLADDLLALGASVVLLVMYSGLLWGALPGTARTSWESHLFGLGVGLALAWWQIF